MAAPEVIVYFGFEPSARVWADKLAKRLQTPETADWLQIVEDQLWIPEDPNQGEVVDKFANADLLRSAHAIVWFITESYLQDGDARSQMIGYLAQRLDELPNQIVVPVATSIPDLESPDISRSLANVREMGYRLVPVEGALDELDEDAEAVLNQIATDLVQDLHTRAESNIPESSDFQESQEEISTSDATEKAAEDAPTLAQKILQATEVDGDISPDGAYLLEAAYALVDKQSKYDGLLTSECLFLAALEWGRRPPGAPSPPHALISLAEAVDAMNPEAAKQMRAEFLVSDTGGGW